MRTPSFVIAAVASTMMLASLSQSAYANPLEQLSQSISSAQKSAKEMTQPSDKNKSQEHEGHGKGSHGGTCPTEKSLRSWDGKTATTVRFVNDSGKPLMTFWLDYKGKRVPYQKLAPGASHDQPTFVTHPWVVTNQEGACLGIYYGDAQLRVITLK